MGPRVRTFGLLALGVVALWLLTILTLNLPVYSAGGFVMGYLRALEDADYGLAATKAGLSEVPLVTPMDSEALQNPKIVAIGSLETRDIVVQASYDVAGEEQHTVFVIAESEPVLWFFTSWAFTRPPTARLELAVMGDSRVVINGTELSTTSLGGPPRTSVLVPGLYEATLATEWVEAEAIQRTITEVGSQSAIRLTPRPTARLKDAASEAVEDYLDACAFQGVLQPSSCPFGITIDDRVIGSPVWKILDYPNVQLGLAGDRASWSLSATQGVAEVTVVVQSLFDGEISEVVDIVTFDLFGVVRGTVANEPVLNLY
jgi:hypothetical protein